jgi:glycosyltransferase involved in cell wall biosynthesis
MSAGPAPIVLLHIFSTFRVGGPQIRFAALANRFGRKYRHIIVAMDNAFDASDRLDPRLDMTLLPVAVRKGHTFANLRLFRGLLARLEPDLLVTYNWGSIEWGMANWASRVRHIHIEDGFGPEEAMGQLPRRVLTRRLVLARSTLVMPSRALEKIACEIWKIPPSRIRFIPNGIDCDRFSDPDIEKYPLAGEGPTVGLVAALRPEKNIERLLEAFALARQQRPCRLLIAGDGTLRDDLGAAAARLGIAADVTFAGAIGDVERVYAALDIFALSSDTEQMPLSVIEAMAAGLPVAATDVGDLRAMLAKENAPFLTARDCRALAGSLTALLSNSAMRKSVGEANRRAARQNFELETMAQAYDALFSGRAR